MKNLLLIVAAMMLFACESGTISEEERVNGSWLMTKLTGPVVYIDMDGVVDTVQNEDYTFDYMLVRIDYPDIIVFTNNKTYFGTVTIDDDSFIIKYSNSPKYWIYKALGEAKITKLTDTKLELSNYNYNNGSPWNFTFYRD